MSEHIHADDLDVIHAFAMRRCARSASLSSDGESLRDSTGAHVACWRDGCIHVSDATVSGVEKLQRILAETLAWQQQREQVLRRLVRVVPSGIRRQSGESAGM